MNADDKKYLKSVEKARPSSEVFSGMVRILKDMHKKTDELLNKVNDSLLKTSKTL